MKTKKKPDKQPLCTLTGCEVCDGLLAEALLEVFERLEGLFIVFSSTPMGEQKHAFQFRETEKPYLSKQPQQTLTGCEVRDGLLEALLEVLERPEKTGYSCSAAHQQSSVEHKSKKRNNCCLDKTKTNNTNTLVPDAKCVTASWVKRCWKFSNDPKDWLIMFSSTPCGLPPPPCWEGFMQFQKNSWFQDCEG